MKETELIEKLESSIETHQAPFSEHEIKEALQSRSVMVRNLVCETLVHYPQDFSVPLWLCMASDKNSLVRTTAVEALQDSAGEKVEQVLSDAFFSDPDAMVRGYAGYSLLKVARSNPKLVLKVEQKLSIERSLFVKAMCYEAFYQYYSRDVLPFIVACFRSKRYQTRCTVVHILEELLSEKNQNEIALAVKSFETSENTVAVKSAISSLKKCLESYGLHIKTSH